MKKTINKLLFIVLLGLTYLAHGDNASLLIKDAWIAEAPPVSKVMVAYLTIKNTRAESIEIIRAASETYSSIEFHESREENGMASMIRHDSLIIPANTELQLKRGGQHLMLFNPTQPLKAGDSVKVTFTLKDNSTDTIEIRVKKAEY